MRTKTSKIFIKSGSIHAVHKREVESQRRAEVIRMAVFIAYTVFRQLVSGQLCRKREKRFNSNRTELDKNKATHWGKDCMG